MIDNIRDYKIVEKLGEAGLSAVALRIEWEENNDR